MTAYNQFDPTSLFAGGDDFPQRYGTVLSGQGVVARGTIVGRVTSSGKFVKSVATANDGSQNPVGVVAETVDATSADAPVAIYEEGEFVYEQCIVDASWSLSTLNASFSATGRGIFLRSAGAVA